MLKRIRGLGVAQEAMTLLEVLLALIILTLIANIFLAVFSTTAIWIKHSRYESSASYYAASLLEELREKPEKINSVSMAEPAALGLGEGYTPTNPAGIMACIDMEKAVDSSRLYHVRVMLSWYEGERKQELALQTIIRKGESDL